jgi:hypothetical protein
MLFSLCTKFYCMGRNFMKRNAVRFASIVMLTMSVLTAACGGGGGGAAAPAAPLAMKGISGNAVNMNGTWDGGCTYSAIDQQNEHDVMTLNGGSGTFTGSVWAAPVNANCTQTTTPDILFNVTATATLASDPTSTAIWVNGTGAVATPPTGISAAAKAAKVTMVFNSATVTLGSDAFVANFNTAPGFCGQTNWVKGVPKNVLNCPAVLQSTTETDYWVVDDSATQLKWYQGTNGVSWQVENFGPMVK